MMGRYNYFMYEAKRNLFTLLGIDNPTEEQDDLVEKFVRNVSFYMASTHG